MLVLRECCKYLQPFGTSIFKKFFVETCKKQNAARHNIDIKHIYILWEVMADEKNGAGNSHGVAECAV